MAVIEINQKPSRQDLKWFGFILPVFFAIVGSVAYFRFDHENVGVTLWTIGGVVTAIYALIPPIRIPAYLGWMYLFFPLGWTISHFVLAVLYYGIVTPIALLMRPFGYDPMRRRFDPKAPSYWIEKRPSKDSSRYLRQY